MAKRAESIALKEDFSLLIDGKLEQSAEHLDVINPAVQATFSQIGKADPNPTVAQGGGK